MTTDNQPADRWPTIERVYLAALERPPGDRRRFVAEACGSDTALQREVESLLAHAGAADQFIEGAAVDVVARQMAASDGDLVGRTSLPGSNVGAYRIISRLGAGGMGEVYRARDTRLGRDVAIKVLPSAFAADPERLRRLEREARLLASLNHPAIGAIYGLEESQGAPALILELVEGPTLAQRLADGPVPLDEALALARQLAEALEAAHEKGIVHRDLKPANIKITGEGTLKVLDFGIAKALAGDGETPSSTTAIHTGEGIAIGTPGYMSPEQVRGMRVDKRADIWAFGCVLYEMLTGKAAFGAGADADPLTSVLTREPDYALLPAATPAALRRALRRCLQKNPKARLHDIADARLEIEEVQTGSHMAAQAPPAPERRTRLRIAAVVVATLLVAAIGVAAWRTLGASFAGAPGDVPAYRVSILPPANVNLTGDAGRRFALSPDGRHLAFIAAAEDGGRQLWIRALDEGSSRVVPGSDGADIPFWSHDSRFLAFFADEKLKKIALAGGPAVTLADAADAAGGTWNQDDVILFARGRSGLYQLRASGGDPLRVTTIDSTLGEVNHSDPLFLPDGRHFLYHAMGSKTGSPFDARAIYVGALGGTERTQLVEGGSNVQYVGGQLLFLRERTLMAQPFDLQRLELTGEPIPVAENIATNSTATQIGAFSASSTTGLVAYQTRSSTAPSRLVWFDRSGRELGMLGASEYYRHPELSLDGTRVAVAVGNTANDPRDIWVVDAVRGVPTRFTFEPTDERFPTWSPDGRTVAFTAGREGRFDIYQKTLASGADEKRLAEDSLNKYPTSWSTDGRFILYYTGGSTPATGQDLWVLPTFGERKPYPFLQTSFAEMEGRFSPDGRWIAYQSNESGRQEIYVAAFGRAGDKWRISADGGAHVRWRNDGRELFYQTPDDRIMAVEVNGAGSTFEVGNTQPLFTIKPASGIPSWVATGDGQRFLVNTVGEATTAAPITLLINFPASLR